MKPSWASAAKWNELAEWSRFRIETKHTPSTLFCSSLWRSIYAQLSIWKASAEGGLSYLALQELPAAQDCAPAGGLQCSHRQRLSQTEDDRPNETVPHGWQ